MISNDSVTLREFIEKMSGLTNSKHFIKGAILQAETEDDLQHIIDFINTNPNATYSDVMYELAIINKSRADHGKR